MKTFSKIVEESENKKFYRVQIELIIPADSEGEAGYISDIILSNPIYSNKHTIKTIDEVNKLDS